MLRQGTGETKIGVTVRWFVIVCFLWGFCSNYLFQFVELRPGGMGMRPIVGDYAYHALVWSTAYGVNRPFFDTAYLFRVPKRGQIVFFDRPGHPGDMVLQRVIGLPSDTIEVRSHVVILNGIPLKRTNSENYLVDTCLIDGGDHCVYITEELDEARYTIAEETGAQSDFGPMTIPPNHLFALGDNRDFAADSRIWGPVPFELVKGRVMWYW